MLTVWMMMLVKVCVLLSLLLKLCAHRPPPAGLKYDGEKELDVWLTGFEPVVLDGIPVTPPCRIFPVSGGPESDTDVEATEKTSRVTTTTTRSPVKRPVLVRQSGSALVLYRLLLTQSSRISMSYVPRRRSPPPGRRSVSTYLLGALQRNLYHLRSRRVSSDSSEED